MVTSKDGRQAGKKYTERNMIVCLNFTASCFCGCLLLWMVGQRQINRQRKRQIDTQRGRLTDRQWEREGNIYTDWQIGRETETERNNDGWLVVSILLIVASIDGCFY